MDSNNNNERINDLILRYLSGECSSSEEKELLSWCDLSAENSEYFQKIKHTWIASSVLREEPLFETENALMEIHKELSIEPSEKTSSKVFTINRVFLQKSLKYAAIFLLIFLTGAVSSFFLFNEYASNQNLSENYYEVPIGSKGHVVLPDGSQVWLNAGSKLNYMTDYNTDSRIVKLEGEGFFDVVTNPEKPFIVNAKKLQIKAYGTAFNVKAYKEDKEVITTLVHGKVFIEGKDKNKKSFSVEMKPKQSVIFLTEENNLKLEAKDEKTLARELHVKEGEKMEKLEKVGLPAIKIDEVKTELYTSWKDSRWIIENMELTELLKDLERRYNVVFLANTDELNNYHFSGTIQNESIEQVLNILRYTLPVKYKINKNHIDINIDTKLNKSYREAL